jgi:ParB-like chromosome segregation protein Spo0J
MTDMEARVRYSIEALLNSGAQPFDDLDEDALSALGKGIGKRGPLADPVSVSSDGVLLDGHQRLKAMRTAGRKFIEANDVRVIPQANRENALEWAVRLNVQRRQLSVEEKAEVARRLQRERRWSQAKIADLFGVSRPAVSQWLANTTDPEDEDAPDYVVGEDGKRYPRRERPVEERPAPAQERFVHPWSAKGNAYRAVHGALKAMRNNTVVGDISPVHKAKVRAELEDLVDAAGEVLLSLDSPSPE